jgi:hypothetical protein
MSGNVEEQCFVTIVSLCADEQCIVQHDACIKEQCFIYFYIHFIYFIVRYHSGGSMKLNAHILHLAYMVYL